LIGTRAPLIGTRPALVGAGNPLVGTISTPVLATGLTFRLRPLRSAGLASFGPRLAAIGPAVRTGSAVLPGRTIALRPVGTRFSCRTLALPTLARGALAALAAIAAAALIPVGPALEAAAALPPDFDQNRLGALG
jgi:hypothetical protein